MNNHQRYKTATFSCLALAIIFFCLIFLIPLVVERMAFDSILNQNNLRSDNYLDWGQFPGSYNVNIQKTYTFFNVINTSSLSNMTYLSNDDSAVYNLNFSYYNPQFVPNTNGQISAMRRFQHLNETDEISLKNHTITQPNLGIYKAFNRETGFLDLQYITFELFRMISSLKENFPSIYFAHAIYHYYISNQTLTFQTILMKNNILSIQQANMVWGDSVNGWSKISGLKPWIDIILSNQFSAHPNWNFYKQIFNLNETQMQLLIGETSKMNELFTAIQGLINDQFQDICYGTCTPQLLYESQWSFQISTVQLLPEIPAFSSYNNLNDSISCTPEIASIMIDKNLFTTDDYESLLAYDDNGEINTSLKSLLNFENINFIIQNANNTNNINKYFALNNLDKALALVNYVQHIQDNCLFREKQTSNLNFSSISLADKEKIGLSNLMDGVLVEPFQQLADFILVNLTNKAIINKNLNCSFIFADPLLQNRSSLCSLAQVNINNLDSNLLWVNAYLDQTTSQAWNYLLSVTNLNEGQLDYFFSKSLYGKTLADFQTTIAKHYNCNFPICTRNELALIQWGNSSITYNLPAAYFNDADRSFSIQGWNPTILGDKTPEIYAFSNYPIDFNITKQLLSYSIGGIFEYHERQNFISFVVENNQTSLQSRFNLNLTEARVLFDYMRSITIQYMFGGLFLSKTPYEFLWGYEDKYLIKMRNRPTLLGGDAHALNISLQIKNNYNDCPNSDPSCFLQLDTGLSDESNSRKVSKFFGKNIIRQRKLYYNGDKLIYYFTNPWENAISLDGTDGFGFKPFIDKNEGLTIFEDKFLRNLKLNCKGKVSCNQYDCQKYEIDQKEFSISNNFNTDSYGIINLTTVTGCPLVVSNPYFINADQATYDKIMVNNKSISDYQQNAQITFLLVEPMTGVTTKMFKNYQYNIQMKKSLLLSENLVGKQLHYPVLLETMNMEYNNERASAQFEDILQKIKTASVFRWLSVSLAALFFIFFLFSCFLYNRGKKNRRSSSSNSQPFLNSKQPSV